MKATGGFPTLQAGSCSMVPTLLMELSRLVKFSAVTICF